MADYGVYDPVRDAVCLVTYNNAGTLGNSIGIVRPDTGALISTIPVGGEPSMMALSSDASGLFLALITGCCSASNMSTQTVDRRFCSVWRSRSARHSRPVDVGGGGRSKHTARFRRRPGTSGTARSTSLLPASSMTFGPTPSAFYSLAAGEVGAWQLNSSGISAANSVILNGPYMRPPRL